ncbi:MAG: universal stress protein [Thermodesulfobacteriota bacterium]
MKNKKNSKSIRRILLPVDMTKASEDALSFAVMLSRKCSARLYVLHVVETKGEAAGSYLPHISFDELDLEMKEAAEAMLGKFASRLLRGVKNAELRLVEGVPYKEITKFAARSGIDMIVMGTFGGTRAARFVFGSTTEKVMRLSGCPVLIVPPER